HMIRSLTVALLVGGLAAAAPAAAAPAAAKPAAKSAKADDAGDAFKGLTLRGLGPAMTSGRIGDVAIHPSDLSTWYVVACSGGLGKTTNAGTTWSPIFDDQGSYSIGCVAIDPKDPLVVWVGTGENNSQRSVGYGDGLYKSEDGGRPWKKGGPGASEPL